MSETTGELRYADHRRLYLISDGERHWVVAESPDQAVSTLAGHADFTLADYRKECSPTVEELPPGKLVKVYSDWPPTDDTPYTERSAELWAALTDSPEIIASTCC